MYTQNSHLGVKPKHFHTSSDITTNPMNATVDEDILNTEWERILHEVDDDGELR